jgi:hypothetical protein
MGQQTARCISPFDKVRHPQRRAGSNGFDSGKACRL